jgi:hypothetical protein
MSDLWSDERIDAALAEIAVHLDVPAVVTGGWQTSEQRPATRRPMTRRPWVLVAAAVLLVLGVLAAISPVRSAVARWFGVELEIDPSADPTGLDAFIDGVRPLGVDEGLERVGLTVQRLDGSGLGRPDAAGEPPEGGVLLAWGRGDTTLWVRPGDETIGVVKKLITADQARVIDGIGDYAVLIDGAHVLETPSRRLAAGRVLWWFDDSAEHRLESDLAPAELQAIAQALDP